MLAALICTAVLLHPPGFYNGDPLPPARYLGGASAVVTTMTPAEVNAKCTEILGPPGDGYSWKACTTVEPGDTLPHVYGPLFETLPAYGGPYAHEWGHVRGWPSDHPK